MATEKPRIQVPARVKRELPPAMKEKQWTSTLDRRRAFIDLMASGLPLRAAMAAMDPPLPRETYNSWRARYPDFKASIDNIRGADFSRQAPEVVKITAESTFADKRYAYFGFESYWHHLQMIDAIETAPAGGVTLILVPPDHGKSTLVQDKISVDIGEDPNIRIIYLTGGLDLGRKAIGRQQGRMDEGGMRRHPRYHADYGPFRQEGRDGNPWAATHFTVMKSTHDEQDYTMEARSWTSKIAGSRVDKMIIDDIQELSSLNQTAAMAERFQQDFMSRITRRKGRVIVIGTRVGDKDFYDWLIRSGLVDKLVMLPATDGTLVDRCEMDVLAEVWPTITKDRKETLRKIPGMLDRGEKLHPLQEKAWLAQPEEVRQALMQLGDRQPVEPCDISEVPHERPLCPEMWPPHALARKRKQVGEDAWWRNFQQKPRNAKDTLFTEDLIDTARNRMSTVIETRPRIPTWRRFAGLDPSLTGGNSLIVCESNGAAMRVLSVRRDFRLTRAENIYDLIDADYKLWGFTHLTIEINAFQKALIGDERLKQMSRLRGFRMEPHTTGINKADPDFGVAQMETVFKDGQIEWAYGDERSRAMFEVLEAELFAWRPEIPTKKLRQDTVMALWFCWRYFQAHRRAWLEDDAKVGRIVTSHKVPWKPEGYAAMNRLSRILR